MRSVYGIISIATVTKGAFLFPANSRLSVRASRDCSKHWKPQVGGFLLGDTMKRCPRCGETKPLDNFGKDSRAHDGKRTYCKLCSNEYHKNYRVSNPERTKQFDFRHYHNRREKVLAYNKQYRKDNKEKLKDYLKKYNQEYGIKQYGITPEEYQEMLERQGGVCAVCGGLSNRKRLFIDHDHKTGRVRGLLCHKCNSGLGLLRDSLEIVYKLASYLKGNKNE